MKILMINLPFAGHTNPTLPLTTKLVEKGHEVFYINAPEFREKIEKTGAKFIPYKDYPLKVTEGYKKRHCFRAAFETAMDFEEQIDILIYEMFFYPGVEIAKRKGIPCVRQFSQPAWSEETWKAAPKIFKISAKLIDMQVLKKSDATRLGLENKCLKDGIINCHPDLNIEYLSEQFQSKKDSFDETYTYIIPTPNVMKGNVTIPYEQMNHPIIYISLGSIISDKSFYKKCVKTFRDKPFSVILNTGKVDPSTLGKMPGNIYAYSFVPQVEVLSHADVFLTHCGMNSINEAMCYGVPMIAMPFMNDQITNAKQLVELGLAKQIRSLFNTSDEIYRAACDVASDEQMKEKARMVMENIMQQVSWDEIIRRIESLV